MNFNKEHEKYQGSGRSGRYGYFDDEAKEYVITNPQTPVKWINYIGTLEFGGFVDHTGGSLLCAGDPAQERITRYVQQHPSSIFKGTTLYIRIKSRTGYSLISPFFVPCLDRYDKYECRTGLGYTRIISEIEGIRTEALIFIPPDKKLEIRDISITNMREKTVEADIVPVVEYSHPMALKQWTNADWIPQTMISEVREESNGLKTLIQYPFMYRDTKVNFFTSSSPVSSYETDRRIFLGNNEYGTWQYPGALKNRELSCSTARRGDNIAALMIHIGKLNPGETEKSVILLGRKKSFENARDDLELYRNPENVKKAFLSLSGFWQSYLSHFQVSTPDDMMNRMLNVYNQYQCFITKNWSRYLSYYQLGYGARGIGMRDSAQDILGVIHAAPEDAKKFIILLLKIQRREGSACHSVNPATMEGSIGEAGEYTGEDNYYYGDDHLWIILSVCEYIKETGDRAFLDEKVDFYDRDETGLVMESGSVLEHMERAVEFTRSNTGRNGLPLLGHADWNDSVNLSFGAESLFVANLYGKALSEMAKLYGFVKNRKNKTKYEKYYSVMKDRVNKCAWDKDWYIRYIDKDGGRLGTSQNDNCIIYANGQSWPVISGFAEPGRAKASLDSVKKHLDTEYGIKLSTKGYNGYDRSVGGISTYPPGAKENCGIFLHTNPWVIIAETIQGNGERAFEYYSKINPACRNDDIDRYEVEPYVYAQNILADEHPQFGLGRNSWLSGTASWAFQAASKHILGICPDYEGLVIDPCIPSAWEEFSVVRKFRDVIYKIYVKNPEHVCRGVASLKIDNVNIDPALPVPVFEKNTEHVVEAVMGKEN